jgi:hypothetical protein
MKKNRKVSPADNRPQARAVDAVTSIQRRSVEQGIDRISMDEINAEIKAVLKKRAQ